MEDGGKGFLLEGGLGRERGCTVEGFAVPMHPDTRKMK